MKELFYLLPLVGVLAGLLTSILGVILIKYLVKEEEIMPLVSKQIDELIITLQKDIPMAGMFLKGKLLDKLKSQAEEKLMQVFPKAKKNILKKIFWKWLCLGVFAGFLIGILFKIAT